MASFYVIRGQDRGQHFAIRGTVATIGRDSSNQIQLHDTEVSRRHARIVRIGPDQFEILDSQSSNGTFVNSRRIQRQALKTGDRIQVGRTLMIFTGGPDPLDPAHLSSTHALAGDASSAEIDLSQIKSRVEPHVALGRLSAGELSVALGSPEPASTDLLEVVYQVSQAIHRTIDLNTLLRQVLDLIFQWVECDRGYILMADDTSGDLRSIYGRDRSQDSGERAVANRPLRISRTILDYVVQHREGVLTSNAQSDTRWSDAASVSHFGIHEAICVPMLGRYGLVGAIYVDTTMSAGKFAERQGRNLLTKEHLKLLMAIAGQAALAIEDTQFYHAMVQAERLAVMGQTIANLSHHVKNILQGIGGGNYLVEEGIHQGNLELIRKGWAIVQRNQQRISSLVMDMLSFSKERTLELTAQDVRQVVSEVVELARSRAAELNVDLRMHLPDQPVIAHADAESLHRALLNVVLNALDACQPPTEAASAAASPAAAAPASPRVEVRLRTDAENVVIEVMDTGVGIAPDVLPRIFTPFESTKGARGTGLGLPVAQKTLREHGGTIEVESELGRGSTFRLVWPRQPLGEPGGEDGPATELL
ncbi:MAG: peptide-binding protein [Pirellulaceae bacterium]|nr:MAG: peptide-binding protein [Pirellulaceae bacterium]